MVGFKSDFWVVVDWLNDFCWLQITSWSPALRDRSQSRVQQEVEGLEKKKTWWISVSFSEHDL